MIKKRWAATSAIALAAAATVPFIRLDRHEAATAPEFKTIDPSVPEAKLLTSVLYLDQWREFGKPAGFAYVPKTRPPGLTGMDPGNPPPLNGDTLLPSTEGRTIDGYHFTAGNTRLFAVVEIATEPTSTCTDTKGMTNALCVRDEHLPTTTDPTARHRTAYFTADSQAALTAADEARRFWATTELVPSSEAAWLTDLTAKARAAAQS
ncbi:hypothetical protein [Paractinoplanes durhamensis]|uniref:Uncharacterized protein n=1 Tax=Paractinoplanes durhamensis TaxID=113563 RepID=A0ABQ3Z000_9ACTN|nr:hypothetical protein [Actinoplanes durhamensis]GIE03161.1 hypothetical protein Adu01nite_45110 [Actinoplanes durhamensis]